MASFEWLGNVLARADSYTWDHVLFVDGQYPFEVKTRAMVLATDPYSDELPALALHHGLKRTLSVQDAQDIVSNARQQRPDAGPAELVQAFNYYWQRDAFIDFSQRSTS